MIQSILPLAVKSFALKTNAPSERPRIDPKHNLTLFPIEQSALGRAVEERTTEFQLGRFCARTALTQLEYDWLPIPVGPSREPIWPDGVAGSITHCNGYVAAAVARARAVYALGIDAELNLSLPEEVVASILTPEEIDAIDGLPSVGIHWDRLIFSAKECVFKAWFPRQRSWLEFHECAIRVTPSSRSFEAHLLLAASQDAPDELRIMHGKYIAEERFIATAIVVPNTCSAID
ncbi:MAG: 4'-phosphopantetheinyl transferase [Pirellula sp.]